VVDERDHRDYRDHTIIGCYQQKSNTQEKRTTEEKKIRLS
jgi:hypothetical protein